jgi:hypothetical protein
MFREGYKKVLFTNYVMSESLPSNVFMYNSVFQLFTVFKITLHYIVLVVGNASQRLRDAYLLITGKSVLGF